MRLITTLGSSRYEEVDYYLADRPDRTLSTRFAPVATAGLLIESGDGKGLGDLREAVLLLTEQAEAVHGADATRELEEKGFEVTIHRIPEGKNEDEVWEIVRRVTDATVGSDAVVADVTHAFRHIPMVIFSALALVSARGKATIQGIYYGAYETKLDGKVPILSLSPLIDLLDGYHAVRQFRETGDGRRIGELLDRLNARMWRASVGSDAFSDLTKGILKVGVSLGSGLPLEAGIWARAVVDKLEEIRTGVEGDLPPVALHLMDEMADTIGWLASGWDGPKNQLSLTLELLTHQLGLIRWYLDRGQWHLALLVMREWIVSRCLLADGAKDWLDYDGSRKPKEAALNALKKRAELGKVGLTPAQIDLAALWDRIAKARNDLAHCGMRPGEVKVEKGRESAIRSLLTKCEAMVGSQELWNTRPAAEFGRLLVSSLGMSPGVLYSALVRTEPDRAIVITTKEASEQLEAVCERAGFSRDRITVYVVENALACHKEWESVWKRCDPELLRAEEVVVNLTGGTTGMQYLVELLGRRARAVGTRVRRVMLLDKRPAEQQAREPFVLGELEELEAEGFQDSGTEDGADTI
jgi:CRISPR-associated Csx2 family protein